MPAHGVGLNPSAEQYGPRVADPAGVPVNNVAREWFYEARPDLLQIPLFPLGFLGVPPLQDDPLAISGHLGGNLPQYPQYLDPVAAVGGDLHHVGVARHDERPWSARDNDWDELFRT